METPFEPGRLYRPDDPEMRQIAAFKTLANWRSMGTGPKWSKKKGGGPRSIRYRGRDILDWIEENLTEAA